jgi:hypothetical protein
MEDFAVFTAISMVIGAIFGIIITLVAAAWVYRDAKQRGNPNALVWAIGVFLFWILALPLYLLQRNSAPSFYVVPTNEPATLCAACGKYTQASVNSAFCPLCGASRNVTVSVALPGDRFHEV